MGDRQRQNPAAPPQLLHTWVFDSPAAAWLLLTLLRDRLVDVSSAARPLGNEQILSNRAGSLPCCQTRRRSGGSLRSARLSETEVMDSSPCV